MVAAAQLLPPRSGQQVGGPQEDRGALVERGGLPAGLGGDGGLDGGGRVGVLGVGEGAQPRGVAVRLHHVDARPAAHPVLAADDVRQVDRVGGQRCERVGEPGAFGRAGRVFVDRLVGGQRHVGDGVHAARIPVPRRTNRWPIGQEHTGIYSRIGQRSGMAAPPAGLGLGQLLLALDRTMVTLVEAPRGLDMPVASVALIDADDVRLGLAVGAGSADLFFLLGVVRRRCGALDRAAGRGPARVPAAMFVKEPSTAAVAAGRGARAPPWWPSTRGRAGNGCTDSSTTSSNTTATAATRSTTPAPTCSGWPSPSPTAPAAWSASRTTSRMCWRTRRPATRPTSCAG